MNVRQLLIIGFVWPEPGSSAAGSRMMELLHLFLKNGWKVAFASTALESENTVNLPVLGVDCRKIALNDASFDVFVRELHPQIVLFDRFMTEEQFGWRVAENCPDALRMLDTEDLHCLRYGRQIALKQNRDFTQSDLFSDIAKREIASIFRSDLTLMISETEMELLKEVFKIDPQLLYYLPFMLDALTKETIESWPLFEQRDGFVFIGNFHHEPNRDAVRYLKTIIWPLIRKLFPEAEIHVYGAYIPPVIAQLHKPEQGFYILGRAEIAADVVKKARVSLAPLRFGAGIKGKLTEAMSCGTPSVTTLIGAESMHGDLPWGGTIADDAESFAKAAVALHQDETLWWQACQNGASIINSRYRRTLFENDFMGHIDTMTANLKQHRMQNFIGQMLMHHCASATKYMSRWIEEKNKNKYPDPNGIIR